MNGTDQARHGLVAGPCKALRYLACLAISMASLATSTAGAALILENESNRFLKEELSSSSQVFLTIGFARFSPPLDLTITATGDLDYTLYFEVLDFVNMDTYLFRSRDPVPADGEPFRFELGPLTARSAFEAQPILAVSGSGTLDLQLDTSSDATRAPLLDSLDLDTPLVVTDPFTRVGSGAGSASVPTPPGGLLLFTGLLMLAYARGRSRSAPGDAKGAASF